MVGLNHQPVPSFDGQILHFDGFHSARRLRALANAPGEPSWVDLGGGFINTLNQQKRRPLAYIYIYICLSEFCVDVFCLFLFEIEFKHV